ncbi:MAG: hypothetical protein LBQ31_07570 [Bacteroidales bacterium]|jgi:hypothetical protein|nr:hypothetical protein [Bacteroidales bacterium]
MSEKVVEGTSVDLLNKASYKCFREYLKEFNPNLHYNTMDDDEFNQRLKIVTNRKLTYGGLLFLGTNAAITDHFSDFRVDYLEIPALRNLAKSCEILRNLAKSCEILRNLAKSCEILRNLEKS